MKIGVWISYDLGVVGDYEGMYAWLDEHKAKECGDNLAFIHYEWSNSFVENITSSLRDAFAINKQTRIYIVYRDRDTTKIRGKFVVGTRKASPWTGYAADAGDALADLDEES
jgi:hypothetical protein